LDKKEFNFNGRENKTKGLECAGNGIRKFKEALKHKILSEFNMDNNGILIIDQNIEFNENTT
jgi:hypothetical protein